MAEVSLPEAERIGRLRLGASRLYENDAAICERLILVARGRMSGYAALAQALHRVDDKVTAAAIRRIRYGRPKL